MELRSCPQGIDAPAYVQGELSSEEAERFEAHLRDCQACRSEIYEVGETFALLKREPLARGSVDLLTRVLAKVAQEESHAVAHRPRQIVLRIAGLAALALFGACLIWAGGQLWKRETNRGRVEIAEAGVEAKLAVDRAVDWLTRAQEPSGGWSAARWGGQGLYDTGLTGLASIALLNSSTPDAQEAPALTRALGFLLEEQSSNGRFGPEFGGTLYNHGIATVAILEAFGSRRQDTLRAPIDRALFYIRRTQTPGGGWGYQGTSTEGPNTAVTCWPLQALILARTLGWRDLEAAIAGGFSHLARVSDQNGRLGYRRAEEFLHDPEALSSMGAFCVLLARDTVLYPPANRGRLLDELIRAKARARNGQDLYRDFFLSSALQTLPSERGGQWPREAQLALAADQIRSGANRGSWEPKDKWAAAGGRLYSTAVAALILEVDQRGKRLTDLIARNG